MMIMDDLAFARFKYVQTSLNTFSGVWKSGDWCRFLSFGPKMAACGPIGEVPFLKRGRNISTIEFIDDSHVCSFDFLS